VLRLLQALLCLAAVALAAWLGRAGTSEQPPAGAWVEVAPGVLRSPALPAGYALRDGDAALLIDAPLPPESLRANGVQRVDTVLLTHHHRDTCAAAGAFLKAKVPVRAAKASAEWLTPEGVRKYWQQSIPLRNSRTAYLVLPAGLDGVACDLEDGRTIDWHSWSLRVVATPGHSRDHVSYAARKGSGGPLLLFSGDALAASGKLWTPFTTDWDHWTDAGLKPAAESLRKLAALKPDVLLPARGPVLDRDAVGALTRTAAAVEEVAFLKSFERFTKQRLGSAPDYRFLAKDQVASAGEKPWTQVSEHLFLTGNTYVLTSKDGAFLVLDPWGKRGADQVVKLAAERRLGPLEVVMFSHAHYDHYDGVYDLPGRDRFQVWTLDLVSTPIAEPYRLRAPFLDPRPVRFDRTFRAGDTAAWREYRFRFHHLPGQSLYTMGVEAVIDSKRCYFTADNFFHQDQFSGTGGWMGLNRSWPLPYAASAQQVLDAAPEWVLAEHGGPFEFNAEDFRRRVAWGRAAAQAADTVCPSGDHRRDWNPHRVTVEPLLQKAKPGATLTWTLRTEGALTRPVDLTLEGRGIIPDQTLRLTPETGSLPFSFALDKNTPPGRHVFALRARPDDGLDGFLGVDVSP
jgi:glyoxylase-like metal-dependent hydrolase (beta-lactamase superfamily II)